MFTIFLQRDWRTLVTIYTRFFLENSSSSQPYEKIVMTFSWKLLTLTYSMYNGVFFRASDALLLVHKLNNSYGFKEILLRRIWIYLTWVFFAAPSLYIYIYEKWNDQPSLLLIDRPIRITCVWKRLCEEWCLFLSFNFTN